MTQREYTKKTLKRLKKLNPSMKFRIENGEIYSKIKGKNFEIKCFSEELILKYMEEDKKSKKK